MDEDVVARSLRFARGDFKPEFGQSLRWDFAMRVARTFSLNTADAMRLLEMVKDYDKERSELPSSVVQGASAKESQVLQSLTETAFDRVADMFQLLQSKPDEELRLLLVKAGYPPPENRLDAVMNNMRRVFGEPTVTWWLAECGKRGILT